MGLHSRLKWGIKKVSQFFVQNNLFDKGNKSHRINADCVKEVVHAVSHCSTPNEFAESQCCPTEYVQWL